MDELTARLADLFRRYQIEFPRLPDMSAAEMAQVIEPFRTEISALIAQHGRKAVVWAALTLSAKPLTRH